MDDRHTRAVLAYSQELCGPREAEAVVREVASAMRSADDEADHDVLLATQQAASGHCDFGDLANQWRRLLEPVREARAKRAFMAALATEPDLAERKANELTLELPAVATSQPEPVPEQEAPDEPLPAARPRRGFVVFPAASADTAARPASAEAVRRASAEAAAQPAPEAAAEPAPLGRDAEPEPVATAWEAPAVGARPTPLPPPAPPSRPSRSFVRPNGRAPRANLLREYRVFFATLAAGAAVVVLVALLVGGSSGSQAISLPPPAAAVGQAAQTVPTQLGHPRRHRHRSHHLAQARAALVTSATSTAASAPTTPTRTVGSSGTTTTP